MAFLSFLNIKEGKEKTDFFPPYLGVFCGVTQSDVTGGGVCTAFAQTGAASVQGLVAESS